MKNKYAVEVAKPFDTLPNSETDCNSVDFIYWESDINEERKRWQKKVDDWKGTAKQLGEWHEEEKKRADKLNTNLLLKTTELVKQKKLREEEKKRADELAEQNKSFVNAVREKGYNFVLTYKGWIMNIPKEQFIPISIWQQRAEEAEAKLKEAADELEKINARLEHPIVDYSDECSERMSHLIKRLRDAE